MNIWPVESDCGYDGVMIYDGDNTMSTGFGKVATTIQQKYLTFTKHFFCQVRQLRIIILPRATGSTVQFGN